MSDALFYFICAFILWLIINIKISKLEARIEKLENYELRKDR